MSSLSMTLPFLLLGDRRGRVQCTVEDWSAVSIDNANQARAAHPENPNISALDIKPEIEETLKINKMPSAEEWCGHCFRHLIRRLSSKEVEEIAKRCGFEVKTSWYKENEALRDIYRRGYLCWKLEQSRRQPFVPRTKAVLWFDMLIDGGSPPASVAIVSGSVGHRGDSPLISQMSLRLFAAKHNYKLLYFNESIDKSITQGHWNKVLYVREALKDPTTEFVVWIDDDAVITNYEFRIENFFALANREIDAILSADWTLDEADMMFNSGVFMLRNTRMVREFVDTWIAGYREYPQYQHGLFHEQSVLALKFYANAEFQRRALRVPACILQSYPGTWLPGDFILHALGGGDDKSAYVIQRLNQNLYSRIERIDGVELSSCKRQLSSVPWY